MVCLVSEVIQAVQVFLELFTYSDHSQALLFDLCTSAFGICQGAKTVGNRLQLSIVVLKENTSQPIAAGIGTYDCAFADIMKR